MEHTKVAPNQSPWITSGGRDVSALFLAFAVLMTTTHAAEVVYFPKGAEQLYAKYLAAMKEPSLFQQSTNKSVEQYRFLWLRTFDEPIAVRIRRDRAEVTLRLVRLSGAGGYDPGKIEHEESSALTRTQWDGLLKTLKKPSFWKLPTVEKYESGYDGSRWILEGHAAGKYHVVDRWTPSADTKKRHLAAFVASCGYLLALSKQEIPEKEDY